MEMVEEVVIVGAGIAGLATAVALKRVGVKALVLEKSGELRATGGALALYSNAWRALDALGVSHKLASKYTPLKRASITDLETGAIYEIVFRNDAGTATTVHRKALLEALAEELSANSIRFSSKLTMIETESHGDSSVAVIHLEDRTIIKAKVLIGCDGVHSVVASWLGIGAAVHSGRSAICGSAIYPEGHRLQGIEVFFGTGIRAAVIPVTDKDVHWFFISARAKGTDQIEGDPKVIQREMVEKYAKDLPKLYLDTMKHTDPSTLTWVPLLSREPWKVAFGKLSKQCITVAGDSMHPMMPSLGQGGCSALEDAVILGKHISTSFIQNGGLVPSQVERALSKYAQERRWRATLLIVAWNLLGLMEEGGLSWGMKLFRDIIFNRFLHRRIRSVVAFDCGKLPVTPPVMER